MDRVNKVLYCVVDQYKCVKFITENSSEADEKREEYDEAVVSYVKPEHTYITENEKCPKCGSQNIVYVKYSGDSPNHYDGASEIKCLDCGARIGRFSGKVLEEGEEELRPKH